MSISPNLNMTIPLIAPVDRYFIDRYSLRDPEFKHELEEVIGWTSIQWRRGRSTTIKWCNESLSDKWTYIIDRYFLKSELDVSLFLLKWGQYVD